MRDDAAAQRILSSQTEPIWCKLRHWIPGIKGLFNFEIFNQKCFAICVFYKLGKIILFLIQYFEKSAELPESFWT